MTQSFRGWKAWIVPLLTLVVPGLSHWIIGKKARAGVFCALVLVMFFSGLALHGALFPLHGPNWLYRLGAVAEMGMGLGYAAGRALGWGPLGILDMADVMFGYGNTFLVAAGLMNMLLIMDAHDIILGRKE